jgi:hypothetical protein
MQRVGEDLLKMKKEESMSNFALGSQKSLSRYGLPPFPCNLSFLHIPNSSVFIFNRNEWAQVDKSLIMWKEEFNWKLQIMWVIL